MKNLDKKHIFIRLEDGEIQFSFDTNVSFNYEKFEGIELFNKETREKKTYGELIVKMIERGGSNVDVFLYPIELANVQKPMKDYRIDKWVFVNSEEASMINSMDKIKNVDAIIDFTAKVLKSLVKVSGTLNGEGVALAKEFEQLFGKRLELEEDKIEDRRNFNQNHFGKRGLPVNK